MATPKQGIAAKTPSIGAGVDLETACDIRLTASDAIFSVRETRIAIAANSPLAVQGSKAVLNSAKKHQIARDLDTVALWNADFLYSDDLGEAIQAFLEKRPPHYRGQ